MNLWLGGIFTPMGFVSSGGLIIVITFVNLVGALNLWLGGILTPMGFLFLGWFDS